MSNDDFDEDTLTSALSALPLVKKTLFGLFCAERLLPNYYAFSRESGWGDPLALKAGLDAAWRVARGEDTGELSTLIAACESAAPETEEFGTELCSAALDAAAAVAALLRGIETDSPEQFAEVASYAYDSVEMFTRGNTGAQAHVAAELEQQRAALKQVDEIATPTLETLWRNVPVSNIGIILP